MDVTSYFQNVLSTSYMVRVRFNGADYETTTGGDDARKKGKGATRGRRKKSEERYTSYKANGDALTDGVLPSETLESLLSKLSKFDRQAAEREDCLKVLVATHILRSTKGTVDGTFTHEALLVIPANVSMAGVLSYPADWKSRTPWMPRPLLEEASARGVEKAEIAVGTYQSYEDYVSNGVGARDRIDSLPADAQWKAYVSYAQGLYNSVFNCTDEKLQSCELHVDDDAVYLLIDDNVNASAPIEELYQRIRTQGRDSQNLALFRSITDLRPHSQAVAELDAGNVSEILDHAGTASREYPLAQSQRLAVRRHGMLPEGEVLAVSGPPGTGKTTLLQSIVADLLVHRALDAQPKPPRIVGTSTNNQAVTNIVDAFTKDVKQQEGTSVFRRWLPDIAIEEGGEGYAVDAEKPLHSLGVYSPSAQKKGDAQKAGYLVDDLSRKQDGLYQLCIGKEYRSVAPEVYCKQASAYLGVSYEKPSMAMKGVYERLQQIDKLRRELVNLVHAGCEFEGGPASRCALIIDMLTRAGAVSEKGNSIPLEACQSLQSLDEALDITVRPLEFWLAIHVFEGMWLTARWLRNRGEEYELSSYKLEHVDKYRDQMAALMPLTVMTMFRLPRQFVYADKEGQRNQAQFGAIDLLIVDEAGQVDTAVGAAAFALARRAVVVGDVCQLPPVWGLEPDSDFMIAQGFMKPGEDQQAVWESLRAHGLTASRNSSVMAAAQVACPWAYQAGSVDEEGADFSFWGEEETEEETACGGLFLSEHRRCIDSIIEYCNDLLYDGKLEPKRGNAQKAAIGLPPMGFSAVDGAAVQSGTSRKNPREAQVVATWIKQNFERLFAAYNEASISEEHPEGDADPKKIVGVVTPFAAQANEVKARLRKLGSVTLRGEEHKLASIVTVGTAHKLQGAECPVVLFSLVYDAKSTPTFVENNPNLMNVAVSRAKDAFIVFGSEALMAQAGGNGVMGLLKYYCYKNKVEPPAMSTEPMGKTERGKKAASGKATRVEAASDSHRGGAERKGGAPHAPAKGAVSEKGVKRGGKKAKSDDAKAAPKGWAEQSGPVSLTAARKASIADGFWPESLEGKTVSAINALLKNAGVIQEVTGGFAPTKEWKTAGVEARIGENGGRWCVYTEDAMRKIVRIIGSQAQE